MSEQRRMPNEITITYTDKSATLTATGAVDLLKEAGFLMDPNAYAEPLFAIDQEILRVEKDKTAKGVVGAVYLPGFR
ncbi:hypothetical protein [Methylobacterium sp. ap11]|uniref:hypothetical protein n=1 Tax=Methylobacterium sp. ap11 TaxID=1761799 RepID=UPI0011604502|nr:hypothetical protein [Methylobacterium sp. ap11]